VKADTLVRAERRNRPAPPVDLPRASSCGAPLSSIATRIFLQRAFHILPRVLGLVKKLYQLVAPGNSSKDSVNAEQPGADEFHRGALLQRPAWPLP